MVKDSKLKTTVHDCTIIKLGGSYAVSLPIKKLEDAKFVLGMPVTVSLEFDLNELEPCIDYFDDIEEVEGYISKIKTLDLIELNLCCDLVGCSCVDVDKPFEEERETILIEMKSHLKFMEKEMKEFEQCENVTKDDFDYDKKGSDTLGLD